MNPRNVRFWFVAALALGAVIAWPAFIARRSTNEAAAGAPSPAPVVRDYTYRDEQVTFWERAARQNSRNDVLSPRMLSSEYMQRYRERADIGDVLRALAMAEREERVVPHSIAADATIAVPLLTLHRFREALGYVAEAIRTAPDQSNLLTREASLDMELGRYGDAAKALKLASRQTQPDDGVDLFTIRSRYDEVTGHLDEGRRLLRNAATLYEAYSPTASAQARAWYHFRLGELAFEGGDNAEAIADEQDALVIFPRYNLAYTALARFELANNHPKEALAAASAAAEIAPLPETLGYEADAQRALGDTAAAGATEDTIGAIERIGNSYRVNDRLIAVFYAEHRMRAGDALAIARRDAANRGDEIYAQDTLAWAAAMAGHWSEARSAIAKALRYDTEDPRLQFHAGMIALHFGERDAAKRRLARALALNASFHPLYADEARATLARL